MINEVNPRYYSVEQLSTILNISKKTISNNAIRSPEKLAPSVKICGRRLFPIQQTNEWLDQLIEEAERVAA